MVAYLAAVTFWFRLGLPLEGPSARAAGSLALLFGLLLFGFSFKGRNVWFALAVAGVSLALAPFRPGIEGAAILAVGLTAAMTFQASAARRDLVRMLLGGVSLFALYQVARLSFPSVWTAEQWLAAGYSGVAGSWLDAPLNWGASAIGLQHVLLGAAMLLSAGMLGGIDRRRAGLASVALALLPLAYLLFIVPRSTGFSPLNNGGAGTAQLFAVQALVLPFVALLVIWPRKRPARQAAKQAPPARDPKPSLGHSVAAIAVPALLVTVGIAAEADTTERAGRGTVLLHVPGSLADMSSASWDRFGVGAQGMYGHWVELLQASGREVRVVRDSIDGSDLEGIDTLVSIVPTAPDAPDAQLVESFVQAGGSLFLLGDHTDLMGSAAVSNSILEPFGIEFRFDTVMESTGMFVGNLEVIDNGVLPTSTLPNQLEILHGASLRLSGPAEPVVIGKLMFGDAGDRHKGGKDAFLGDYRLQPHFEQMGDLVLAAKANYGAGRVLVFGDTSGFQNIALPRSSAVVLRLFDWLDGEDVGGGWLLHGLGLLAGGLVVLGLKRRRDAELRGISAGLGLLWLVGGAASAPLDNATLVDELEETARIFLVADSTFTYAANAHFTDDSFDGLLVNAARSGLTPLIGDPSVPTNLAACEVIAALPTAVLADGSVARLTRYVNDGGTLLIATGYEEAAGVQALLDAFGFEIVGLPMGAAPVLKWDQAARYKGPLFAEAWPIVDVQPELGRVRNHFELDGQALVVDRQIGAGRVIVIGDSWFLTDSHLEAETEYVVPNINFLAELLGWK